MSVALKIALAPVWLAQGFATRRRALVLPEASGSREGRVGGAGLSVLRVLIAGDSSAAGVGVAEQRQAVSGHLARALHAQTGCAVEWRLRARSGLTTRGVHELLRADAPPAADVAVVISGVNDVTRQLPVRAAIAHRLALADWLLGDRLVRHVVFAPLPPLHRFPLLPQPLRWALGADARRHDDALARAVRGRDAVSHLVIAMELDATTMAPDGFHPGEPVYRACGDALAAHIAEVAWPRLLDSRAPA